MTERERERERERLRERQRGEDTHHGPRVGEREGVGVRECERDRGGEVTTMGRVEAGVSGRSSLRVAVVVTVSPRKQTSRRQGQGQQHRPPQATCFMSHQMSLFSFSMGPSQKGRNSKCPNFSASRFGVGPRGGDTLTRWISVHPQAPDCCRASNERA